MIVRAVAKAEELKQRGSFVVVDGAGMIVSRSRMDRGSTAGLYLSTAKARAGGAGHETSAAVQARYVNRSLAIFSGYEASFPFDVFIGQGAIPVRQDGWVVGAIATGAEIGPYMRFPGVDPTQLIADGAPTNVEDLIISYALNGPYLPQHGDDMERWVDTFGAPPDPGVRGTGLDDPAPASEQPILDAAMAICDRVIAAAERRGKAVCVTVLDRNGVPIQQDRMDGAGPMTPDISEAAAFAALCAGSRSEHAAGRLDLQAIAPPRRLSMAPGGRAFLDEGTVIGAVGVNGAADLDGELADLA